MGSQEDQDVEHANVAEPVATSRFSFKQFFGSKRLVIGLASVTTLFAAPVAVTALQPGNPTSSSNNDTVRTTVKQRAANRLDATNPSGDSGSDDDGEDSEDDNINDDVTVIVNGQEVPVPEQGSVNTTVPNSGNNTNVSITVDGSNDGSTSVTTHTSNNSSSSSSVHVQSNSNGSSTTTTTNNSGRRASGQR